MVPVELLTMGTSTILGGVMALWSQSIESKKQQSLANLNALKQEQKGVQEARQATGLQWTRRVISLAAVGSIIVFPKLAALLDIPVTYGWTTWESGFWFFTEGKDIVQWHSVMSGGILITPLDTHLVSAIIGLYFGGSLARR